jgi:hypothetical protein
MPQNMPSEEVKPVADLGAIEAAPLVQRVKPLQDRILAHPPTGDEADKVFYDTLNGDD